LPGQRIRSICQAKIGVYDQNEDTFTKYQMCFIVNLINFHPVYLGVTNLYHWWHQEGNLVYISVMLYNILTLHIGVPELSNMGIHDSVYLFTAYLYNYCRL